MVRLDHRAPGGDAGVDLPVHCQLLRRLNVAADSRTAGAELHAAPLLLTSDQFAGTNSIEMLPVTSNVRGTYGPAVGEAMAT